MDSGSGTSHGVANGLPYINVGGVIHAPQRMADHVPIFSARKRYSWGDVNEFGSGHPCLEGHAVTLEEVAWRFAGKLREDFPLECSGVNEATKTDLLLYFDRPDMATFGQYFLSSVLDKMAWTNARYANTLKSFANDWFTANSEGHKLFLNCNVIPWSYQDVAIYGRGFLDNVLLYCQQSKALFLQESGKLMNTSRCTAALTVIAKIANSAENSEIPSNLAAPPNGHTQNGPVICRTTTPSPPPLESPISHATPLAIELPSSPTKASLPRRTSSCPPSSESDAENARELRSAIAAARREASSPPPDRPVEWASVVEEDGVSVTQSSQNDQQSASHVDATNQHSVNQVTAGANSEKDESGVTSQVQTPDAILGDKAMAHAAIKLNDATDTTEADIPETQGERRRSFDEVAREFLQQSKEVEGTSQAPTSGPIPDICSSKAVKPKATSPKNVQTDIDPLASVINTDPSIISAGIDGEHCSSPDQSPKQTNKSKSSHDSLSSLICQDPAIMAAGLDGQERISPDLEDARNTHLIGNLPQSGGPVEASVVPFGSQQAQPDQLYQHVSPPPGHGYLRNARFEHNVSHNNFSHGGPPRSVPQQPHHVLDPQSFSHPHQQLHSQPLILNPEVPQIIGTVSLPLMSQLPYTPGHPVLNDGRAMFPHPGNAFAPMSPPSQHSLRGSPNPQKLYTDDARKLGGVATPKRSSFNSNRPNFPSRTLSYAQNQSYNSRDASGNTTYYSATSRNSSNQSGGSAVPSVPAYAPQHQTYAGFALNPMPATMASTLAPNMVSHPPHAVPQRHLSAQAQPFWPPGMSEANSSSTCFHEDVHNAQQQTIMPQQNLHVPKRGKSQQRPGQGFTSAPKQDVAQGSTRQVYDHWTGHMRQQDLKKLHISSGYTLTEQGLGTMFSPFKPFNIGPIIKSSKSKYFNCFCFVE